MKSILALALLCSCGLYPSPDHSAEPAGYCAAYDQTGACDVWAPGQGFVDIALADGGWLLVTGSNGSGSLYRPDPNQCGAVCTARVLGLDSGVDACVVMVDGVRGTATLYFPGGDPGGEPCNP